MEWEQSSHEVQERLLARGEWAGEVLGSALPAVLFVTRVASKSSQAFVLGTRRKCWFSSKTDEAFTPLALLMQKQVAIYTHLQPLSGAWLVHCEGLNGLGGSGKVLGACTCGQRAEGIRHLSLLISAPEAWTRIASMRVSVLSVRIHPAECLKSTEGESVDFGIQETALRWGPPACCLTLLSPSFLSAYWKEWSFFSQRLVWRIKLSCLAWRVVWKYRKETFYF